MLVVDRQVEIGHPSHQASKPSRLAGHLGADQLRLGEPKRRVDERSGGVRDRGPECLWRQIGICQGGAVSSDFVNCPPWRHEELNPSLVGSVSSWFERREIGSAAGRDRGGSYG